MRLKTHLLTLAAIALLAIGPALSLAALRFDGPAVTAPASAPASHSPLEALPGALTAIGAIKVKDAASVAAKWRTRAGAAASDYKTGVQGAAADWEANTAAAADNYAQGTSQAIADGRFAKGVRAAGGAKFAQRAGEIGATRYAPGVQASEGAMAQGIQPVLQVIQGITLPPRRPRGDQGNMERASVVAMALRKWKTGK